MLTGGDVVQSHGSVQQSLLRLGKRRSAARGGSRESLKAEVHDIKEAESALIRKAEQIREAEEKHKSTPPAAKEEGKAAQGKPALSSAPPQTHKEKTQLAASKAQATSREKSLSQVVCVSSFQPSPLPPPFPPRPLLLLLHLHLLCSPAFSCHHSLLSHILRVALG